MRTRKFPHWHVCWLTRDEPPIFHSVKFPNLFQAVVTCYRLWRSGNHVISLGRFKGGRTFDPAMDHQPQVRLLALDGRRHFDCVFKGLHPAPLELAIIRHKDLDIVHYTVRCPMCWTYSGFHDTEKQALHAWQTGNRIAVKKD